MAAGAGVAGIGTGADADADEPQIRIECIEETAVQYERRAYRTIGHILEQIGIDADYGKIQERICDWGHVRYEDSKGDVTFYIVMDQETQNIIFHYDIYDVSAFKRGIHLIFNEKDLGIAMQSILPAMKLLCPPEEEQK